MPISAQTDKQHNQKRDTTAHLPEIFFRVVRIYNAGQVHAVV